MENIVHAQTTRSFEMSGSDPEGADNWSSNSRKQEAGPCWSAESELNSRSTRVARVRNPNCGANVTLCYINLLSSACVVMDAVL